MNQIYNLIGSKVSIITKSDIRYEGTLYTLDHRQATIALSNVQILGTEDRVVEKRIPPSDSIYNFIVFKGADIKDFKLCSHQPSPADPAIISVGAPTPIAHVPQQQQQQPAAATTTTTAPAAAQEEEEEKEKKAVDDVTEKMSSLSVDESKSKKKAPLRIVRPGETKETSATVTATTTTKETPKETPKEEKSDVSSFQQPQRNYYQGNQQQNRRGGNGGGSGGYVRSRGGFGQQQHRANTNKETFANESIPKADEEDFDFAASNEKYDKTEVEKEFNEKHQHSATAAYDKNSSFFDTLSRDTSSGKRGGHRGGYQRGGGYRGGYQRGGYRGSRGGDGGGYRGGNGGNWRNHGGNDRSSYHSQEKPSEVPK